MAQDNHLFYFPECGPSTGSFKIQLIKDYMYIDLTFFIIMTFIYIINNNWPGFNKNWVLSVIN